MDAIILAIIDSPLALWTGGIFLLLLALEVLASLIKSKDPKNPLFWIDYFATTSVRVVWRRLKKLAKLFKN